MVLLHDIVSIFHLTDGDGCAVGLVVAFDGGFIGVTVVDGHGVRETIAADGLLQKPQRGCCIPVLREEKVNGLAVFIHRTIQIPPRSLHFDVRLVHPPAAPDRPLPTMKRLCQLGALFADPAVDGGVIHVDPTFLQECFDMACAQGIRHIPADAHQHNLWREMRSFEADRHVSLPHVVPLVMEGDPIAHGLKGKLATKPHQEQGNPSAVRYRHRSPRASRARQPGARRSPVLGVACVR